MGCILTKMDEGERGGGEGRIERGRGRVGGCYLRLTSRLATHISGMGVNRKALAVDGVLGSLKKINCVATQAK
jgi:hypothetical protein